MKTAHRADYAINQDVLQALEFDPRIDETAVNVRVKSGVVTLTGEILNQAQEHAVLEAAHRVEGVLDVVDELEIRSPSNWAQRDAELAQVVRTALASDALAPHQEIQSTIAKGWVTLGGEVEFAYQREDAGRVVGALTGIAGMTNRITVKQKSVDPARVRTAIEAALRRQTAREARHIDIRVEGGIVTLEGVVHSRVERLAIDSSARFSPGVQSVVNKLTVRG